VSAATAPSPVVPADVLRRTYDELRTPHKYGIVLRGAHGLMLDCPSVFRFGGRWFLVYVCMNEVGYETHLAASDNLLKWEPLGKVLSFGRTRDNGLSEWDQWQRDGGIALVDHTWGGSCAPQSFDGKYWMSYIGGALKGYEPDPLSIGIAWSTTPDKANEWNRIDGNPVLGPSDKEAREFEKKTIYKSQIIWDRNETLGHPFVMFYNGKQEGPATERIGIAVSQDMVHWSRFGPGPVIDNGPRGISGDPQIVRIGDLWVMIYFGHVWKPKAFDTFACSYDLVNWTKWTGEHLVEPSEMWDATFAHKPWMLKHDGVVYHFYCAVGNEGRVIALATSKEMR
jgi:predicted GH43/DUF377 family glycosyl hydrolase